MQEIDQPLRVPQSAVYSLKEASELLRCDSRTLKATLAKPDCPIRSIKVGRQLKVVATSLNNFLGLPSSQKAEKRG